ncbi:cytosolic sulfotransferase 5-like [Jatropha curcas]|uniref:cytosolic sulfotransferase 5-like n=1 Tax=Jatropha curcas TaxID=180498 RepID=UPI0005FBBE02|nr:cytosolic sulfotransferase 5-like [Jatropha curcas]
MASSSSADLLLHQLPKENFWDLSDLRLWEGSTWLRALCFSIMNAKPNEEEEKDTLAETPPDSYVRNLEAQVYLKGHCPPDLSNMPSPGLFHSHLAYNSLPASIKNSNCKMVYITRNPKDTLVSMWHFFNSTRTSEQESYPFDKAFDSFCQGIVPGGPFFEHVLQYWHESLRRPDKILFLKYEELQNDPKEQVRKLASFLGRPFAKEEEIDKVLGRCNFLRLKNLEINQKGTSSMLNLPHGAFFRRGVTGDWKNYLTAEMSEKLDQITRTKLLGISSDTSCWVLALIPLLLGPFNQLREN